MKIGVISDIHSNVIAFKNCIRYMEEEKCDEYLFLGDYVSDTPYARETLDQLYDFIKRHPCYLLRGNREEYMLDQRRVLRDGISEKTWIYNSASGNLLYTYEQLTDDDLDFFESLPIT
nr:metallophosphoesterase [Lachnospiraceae bacterium]